jgi:UDP-N-acetyl-D-mannosaminuronate dehydrogenase
VSQEYALAYRDVNIALANEFALVAERVGIDVWEAITLANRHPRVQILQPGPGVGGIAPLSIPGSSRMLLPTYRR